MSSIDFEFLINLIGPKVTTENTNFRESISVAVRLAITLRFLSSGDSYHSLMYTFKISKQSISQIVPEDRSRQYNKICGHKEKSQQRSKDNKEYYSLIIFKKMAM
ncbi:Hypothetical protein CINCED_3A011491 [Cinara cedri]|uniref:Harbinger transposase-derived nuclease domain n=1 Tax=Cinara cedri TaxID=506608 RepID=A0A5E4N948_9HEMI|nr:Hypothetical protein CINCED_3A011491 [Cinara cedri]